MWSGSVENLKLKVLFSLAFCQQCQRAKDVGKCLRKTRFFALGEKIFALDGKIFASDTTNRLQSLNP